MTTTAQRPPVKRTPQQVLEGSVRELLAEAHRDGIHPYTALMDALRAR